MPHVMDGSLFADASEQDPPISTGPPFSLTDIEPLAPTSPVEPIELEFPPDPTEPPGRSPRAHAGGFLPTFPALDGLKGIAIVVVLLFDAGLGWAKGGHLGVSTLFTLAGFLAVAGLLAERGDGQGIDVRAFWARRIRRVLAATLAALAVAGVFGLVAASDLQRRALAVDGITSLLSVANWRFILDDQAFGPAFGLASPARQFWALSLLGQLLIVIPLLVVGVLGVLRWSRDRLGVVFAVGIVASVGLSLALSDSPTRVLYGTGTRAAEVLAGCLLAVVIYDPRVTIRLAVPGPVRDTINAAGVVAGLGLLAAYALMAPAGRITMHGGLAVVAALSSAVVLASIVPEGPVHWLLSRPPVRWLGRIAIALYLIHWPIFVWLSAARTELSIVPLTLLRFAVALAAATVLQLAADRLLHREHAASAAPGSPSRTLTWMGAVAGAAVVALLLATSLTTPDSPTAQIDTASGTDTTAPAAVPTVAFYGDAMATTLEAAAKAYGTTTGNIAVVPGVAAAGCGIDRDGTRVGPAGPEPVPAACTTWETTWASSIAATDPDVVVLVTGLSEVADHQFDPAGPWVAPGEASYDYKLYLLMTKAVEVLGAQGARVVWLNMPPFGPNSGAAADARRVEAFNAVLAKLAVPTDGSFTIGDLSSWIAANGGPAVYPTSEGFGANAADLILTGYLGPQIAAVAATAPPDTTSTTTAPAGTSTEPSVTVTPATVGG
ncbi:MAG: acyltransferase family protein [Acidimicrobiales bacterium]